MRYFWLSSDQLISLEFGDIRQRSIIGDGVRKQEIVPALLPIQEPKVFNPAV